MRRKHHLLLIAVLFAVSYFNAACAKDVQNVKIEQNPSVQVADVVNVENSAQNIGFKTDSILVSDVSSSEPKSLVTPVATPEKQAPVLTAPVVADPGVKKNANSRKVDLHAIIFDPNTMVKPPENVAEMTSAEVAKYKINEALHGEVSAVPTKGLLEDTMKMNFKKGPIESLSPWIDYSGMFQNLWTGDNYANTLYGVNFNDFGINGKFRTNETDGKKTVFRIMFNTGKEIAGNTYMQSFLADNYIMRYWTKDDQILIGNARTAVGLEGSESPYTIPLFNRSQISRTYGNVRAVGAKAQGNHKMYDYSAGIFSSGRFFKDFFPGPEFVGMFSVKPLGLTDGRYGKLTMGGSLDSGNSDSNFCIVGAHTAYEYKRLKATFEYATADGSNGSTGFTSNSSEGFYGNLAYRITPRLQAVVRYDQFDPNKNKANDRRTEYTAGLNYFIKGQALKLMLNYVYYTVENGTFGSKVLLGTQIIL